MPRIRKRVAIAVARNFAVGLLENAQCSLLESTDLTEEELGVMQEELQRLANRIDSSINLEQLAQAKSDAEVVRREMNALTKF